MRPHIRYEKNLLSVGQTKIVGVDEVGRGAWAGPLIACAVMLPIKPRIRGIRDSKKLSPKKREQLAKKIKQHALRWTIGIVTHKEIDTMGITIANELAMIRAIQGLHITPDCVLVDAFTIYRLSVRHFAIPHGDATVYSIAAASIIAKVERDHLMTDLNKKHSGYGFQENKGYGTPDHKNALDDLGMCAIHRRSFHPMKQMI